jgi:hypothetical protein
MFPNVKKMAMIMLLIIAGGVLCPIGLFFLLKQENQSKSIDRITNHRCTHWGCDSTIYQSFNEGRK